VNAAVKYREAFRPFAPAILAEAVDDWFETEHERSAPFMEKVLMFREEVRDMVQAVVHVDGTGRLQTVEREANPRFYDLIAAFERLTGIPIVLNTSFNLNGEPIVCTPTDAIRTFSSCGLDALILGERLLSKGG
jgi:carbamoyltransferase